MSIELHPCTLGAQSGGRLAALQASSVALLMEVEGGCCCDDDGTEEFLGAVKAVDAGTGCGIRLSGESVWRLGSSWGAIQ